MTVFIRKIEDEKDNYKCLDSVFWHGKYYWLTRVRRFRDEAIRPNNLSRTETKQPLKG